MCMNNVTYDYDANDISAHLQQQPQQRNKIKENELFHCDNHD